MAGNLPNTLATGKYPAGAFQFVQRGLNYTADHVHGDMEQGQSPASRHITGQQLCVGLRDFAISEYGLMARTVLGRWRIHATEDFGHIVFLLVEAKALSTTEGDSIRDFIDVYRFEESFPTAVRLPD